MYVPRGFASPGLSETAVVVREGLCVGGTNTAAATTQRTSGDCDRWVREQPHEAECVREPADKKASEALMRASERASDAMAGTQSAP